MKLLLIGLLATAFAHAHTDSVLISEANYDYITKEQYQEVCDDYLEKVKTGVEALRLGHLVQVSHELKSSRGYGKCYIKATSEREVVFIMDKKSIKTAKGDSRQCDIYHDDQLERHPSTVYADKIFVDRMLSRRSTCTVNLLQLYVK